MSGYLDVIDFASVCSTYTVAFECLPDTPGVIRQWLEVIRAELTRCIFGQEEPIAAPRYIAFDGRGAVHGKFNVFQQAITCDVFEGHLASLVKLDGYDSDGGFESVHAGLNSAEVCKCCRNTDGAVPAHTEVPDVIKKDHAG